MAAAAEGQFQAITKAMVSITEADKVRKEAELLLKSEAKWEEIFMPAPISIAILGELVLISMRQKDDVSINKNRSTDGFKAIEHPESFRACLRQVSERAWEAFNEVNMQPICWHSKYVSEQMTNIMQGFFQNTQVEKNQLQTKIKKIQDKAEKCTESAQAMQQGKFLEVIFLVKELLQACQNAEYGYEKDLDEMRIKLKEVKIKQESVRKTMEDAKWKQMQVEGETKKALNEIEEALNFSLTSCYDIGSDMTDKTEWIKKQLSKVEESGEALRQSHKEDHRSVKKIIELMKEQTEILCEMKEYEMRGKDLETAKKMVNEGQSALGKVEQQWDKMMQFFHMISNLIQFCFNWHIQECLASVEGIQQITHAFNASNIAQLVHMFSKIFTQVCEKYLINLVSITERILTMEPSNPSFDSECAKIDSGCAKAQEDISNLVLEMKNEFKRNLNAGLETIEKMKAMQHP
ncbi:uncharacterized protein LOC103307080 [Chrysemys picta bellii]|uniref:uncharacterized protein LOC103307080 n=1 Tax=Chrysemys picta bellii TaxID=8478 RepID=UPI0032B18E23